MSLDYFEDEIEPPRAPATLERLTKLARDAELLTEQLAIERQLVAEKEEKLVRILRTFIPDIMSELSMSEFKMVDGSVITVVDAVQCSLTEEHKPEAFEWLIKNKFDGIIKTRVMSSFGRGEYEKAQAAITLLTAAGYEAILDQNIHPMTLKAFVKEQLEKGTKIPITTFGIFEFKQAKIRMPKK